MITDQALKQYFEEFSNVSQLSSGQTNQSFVFEANGKKYILRFYAIDPKTPRTEQSISLEIDLINLFGSKGLPTPIIIPNKKSKSLSEINGRFFDVFEYIEGGKVYGKLKAIYFEQVGYIMAKMHNITIEQDLKTNIRWPEGDFWTHVQKLDDKNSLSEPELTLLTSLPQYLIHGDFHFGNLLFRNDELVAVLDFDHYRMGHLIDDILRSFVAEMAHTTLQEYSINQEFVNAFWDGYLSVRKLSEVELKLIPVYIQLHYLNQLARLQKEKPEKIPEFQQQVEELTKFTKSRLSLI